MPWKYAGRIALGLVLLGAMSGCADPVKMKSPQQTTLGKCTIACNATGAWVFDDGTQRWIGDIWMQADGIKVRHRASETVRFYRSTSLDNYLHEDGERLEFKTNDRMIRHLPSGRSMPQSRVPS